MIEIVQNNFLDRLAFCLWPCWWLTRDLVDRNSPYRALSLMAIDCIFILLLPFTAWLIGFLAIHQRQMGKWAFKRD